MAEELTSERLSELLRDAERAHAECERDLGRRDEEWASWYARYIIDRLR